MLRPTSPNAPRLGSGRHFHGRFCYGPRVLTVDEFESAFRGANKVRFKLGLPEVRRVLVLTDLEGEAHAEYCAAARALIGDVGAGAEYVDFDSSALAGVESVLALVRDAAPDLVCTYRNLKTDAWRWNYSLGVYLNAVTRGFDFPVVVTPSPHAFPVAGWEHRSTDRAMAVTDRLTGDDVLVNWVLKIIDFGGMLWLMHVEDADVFDCYICAIAKIPSINTGNAREVILDQLLREPRDYIQSCVDALAKASAERKVEQVVTLARSVADYRAMIEDKGANMLIFRTMEQDHIALHGIAYSLAVELTDTPLLML